jgi:hypothetical protein
MNARIDFRPRTLHYPRPSGRSPHRPLTFFGAIALLARENFEGTTKKTEVMGQKKTQGVNPAFRENVRLTHGKNNNHRGKWKRGLVQAPFSYN